MPLNGRIGFTLAMLVIFTTMVVVALDYPPASRFAPLVIGIPGILLTLGQLALDIHDLRRPSPARPPADSAKTGGRRAGLARKPPAAASGEAAPVVKRELLMFAWFFGVVAGIVLFGFWLTLPVFILLFLRLHERERWPFALSLTAAGSVVLYLVFERILGIFLHQGFITRAVLDWLAP